MDTTKYDSAMLGSQYLHTEALGNSAEILYDLHDTNDTMGSSLSWLVAGASEPRFLIVCQHCRQRDAETFGILPDVLLIVFSQYCEDTGYNAN